MAIVTISSYGCFHVQSIHGNTRLGGSQFVEALVEFCIKKLEEMGIDTNFSRQEYAQIRTLCEKAKIVLSTRNTVDINFGDKTVVVSVDEYNRMIKRFIGSTMNCVLRELPK